jgi:hypothetical protein
MEKETIAIASAIAGAVVTTAAALVVRRLEQAQNHQIHTTEVIQADREGYGRGWMHATAKLLLEQTGEREVFSDPATTT